MAARHADGRARRVEMRIAEEYQFSFRNRKPDSASKV